MRMGSLPRIAENKEGTSGTSRREGDSFLERKHRSSDIAHYWGWAIVATLLVAVAPPAFVMWLEAAGHLKSSLIAIVLGILGSVGAAAAGTALWMRHSGSSDIVFG